MCFDDSIQVTFIAYFLFLDLFHQFINSFQAFLHKVKLDTNVSVINVDNLTWTCWVAESNESAMVNKFLSNKYLFCWI